MEAQGQLAASETEGICGGCRRHLHCGLCACCLSSPPPPCPRCGGPKAQRMAKLCGPCRVSAYAEEIGL